LVSIENSFQGKYFSTCGVVLVGVGAGRRQNRIILNVIPISLMCPSKNEVTFKITIELVIDQN
jgi:hypothetical protein